MKTQKSMNTSGIEVVELEMEEIEIKDLNTDQQSPGELSIPNQDVVQYRYSTDSQMVA